MSTDTPTPESEVSIESRLAAAFAAEETGVPEAAPVEAAPEASEEPTAEVETEEVAEDVTQLRSIESQLKQYQDADWPALYEANPGQALRFQQVMRDLEKQVSQKQQEINAKVQHVQQATQKHHQFQWEAAEKGARQMIGDISAADNAAMLRTVESLGITPQEFKSRFADPRIIAMTHKAAKWDALQAGKSKAVQAANQAPPVVKPGASKGPGAASEQKYKDVRASLRKSGSLQDAAKLMLLRGLK